MLVRSAAALAARSTASLNLVSDTVSAFAFAMFFLPREGPQNVAGRAPRICPTTRPTPRSVQALCVRWLWPREHTGGASNAAPSGYIFSAVAEAIQGQSRGSHCPGGPVGRRAVTPPVTGFAPAGEGKLRPAV